MGVVRRDNTGGPPWRHTEVTNGHKDANDADADGGAVRLVGPASVCVCCVCVC